MAARWQALLLWPAVWLLTLLLCGWIYQPGLGGPALLDDAVNLRVLETLGDQPAFLADVVGGNTAGPLGRPLSMLSFSLERLYRDAGTRGHKQVNLLLHLLIATVLLLFCRDTLRALGYPQPVLLAMAAASLWLFSPLLVSTVLYIVQRMAQLATLFMLLSLWSYLRCRTSSGGSALSWGLVCVLATLAAPLCKENGLLALPLLGLMEWLVLGYRGFSPARIKLLNRLMLLLLVAGILLFVSLMLWLPAYVFGGYAQRDFTLYERLLSEARILWAYITQLLWVNQSRLGLFHDSQALSTGLLQPWTTLVAVMGWLAVAVTGLLLARGKLLPGVVLGMGIYIVAHLMESSIFPLELYFEHRNYLPAMGVFLALVAAAASLWRRFPWSAQWLLAAWLVMVGHGAYVTAKEVELWSDSGLLHFTAVNRFADSTRANLQYAHWLARAGAVDEALHYAAVAARLDDRQGLRQLLRELTLRCLASDAIAPAVIGGMSATAADFSDDEVSRIAYVLVKTLMGGHCPATDKVALADQLKQLTLVSDPAGIAPQVYLSLAILENELQRYAQALAYVDALLQRSPGTISALMMKLFFTSVIPLQAEHAAVRRELEELQAQGMLNLQQQYNLALFTTPARADKTADPTN